MKKKGLLVLLVAVCVLLVGCGKKTQTMTCSQEEDGAKVEVVMEYNTKDFKFEKITMEMSAPKDLYADMGMSDDDLIKMACAEEDQVTASKDCKAEIKDDKLVAKYELDAEKEGENMLKDNKLEAGKDTLNDLKEAVEKDGYTCTIK